MNTVSAGELRIAATPQTPDVVLNPEGYIRISGRSMSPKMGDFVTRIEDWINVYTTDPASVTVVDFNLEYLSTSNINIYIFLLGKLHNVAMSNRKMVVNWHYDDGDLDIFEKGEDIAMALNLPFRFCKNSAS